MNDQRNKEIRKGSRIVALIGAGAQMVGSVSEIRSKGILISCEMSLAVIPGQPPTVLVLPDNANTRQPEGELVKSFVDESDRIVLIGDDVCCMMNHGFQVICTVMEIDPGSAGGGIVTGMRRGGQAVTQMRSGYIKLAGEFVLPSIKGKAPCLLLEKEEAKVGEPQELVQ